MKKAEPTYVAINEDYEDVVNVLPLSVSGKYIYITKEGIGNFQFWNVLSFALVELVDEDNGKRIFEPAAYVFLKGGGEFICVGEAAPPNSIVVDKEQIKQLWKLTEEEFFLEDNLQKLFKNKPLVEHVYYSSNWATSLL